MSREVGERERPNKVYHHGSEETYDVLAWICDGAALVQAGSLPALWTGVHGMLHMLSDTEGVSRAANLLRTEPSGEPEPGPNDVRLTDCPVGGVLLEVCNEGEWEDVEFCLFGYDWKTLDEAYDAGLRLASDRGSFLFYYHRDGGVRVLRPERPTTPVEPDLPSHCTCESPDTDPALIANDCPVHNWSAPVEEREP